MTLRAPTSGSLRTQASAVRIGEELAPERTSLDDDALVENLGASIQGRLPFALID